MRPREKQGDREDVREHAPRSPLHCLRQESAKYFGVGKAVGRIRYVVHGDVQPDAEPLQ